MNEGRELIDRLCTAAGMIMEDVVEQAIVSGPAAKLPPRIAAIEQAGRDIVSLARAAAVLSRPNADD